MWLKEELPVKKSRAYAGPEPTVSDGAMGEGGMTLIEVMIVVAILAAGLLGTLAVLLSCASINKQSEEQTVAFQAAREKMEEIREIARQSLEDVITSYNANPDDDPSGPGTAPGPAFAVARLNLRPGAATAGSVIVDDSSPELLDVRVVVEWRSVVLGDQEFDMAVLLASY